MNDYEPGCNMEAPKPPSTEGKLSEAKWMERLRARFIERAGDGADTVADAVSFAEWSDGFENDPEGAADEEMSYWENDSE